MKQYGRGILGSLVLTLLLGCETVGEVLSSESSTGGDNGEGAPGGAGESAAGGGATYDGAPSDLSAGDAQTCFIDAGRLYCFGRGAEGALGSGLTEDEPIAVQVGTSNDYILVRTGGAFTCALQSGGVLECTGSGESGELGDGPTTGRLDFRPIRFENPVSRLATGSAHACVITESGALYCWGRNTEGQLGQDDPFPAAGVDRDEPVVLEDGRQFQDVSAGQGHTCAVDMDGALLCWGRNSDNQLGLGEAADDQLRLPTRVGEDSDWVRVVAGQGHSCAQKSSGALYCFGDNSSGQLGLGDRVGRDRPTLVAEDVLDFDLDTFHTCIVRTSGVLCSGRGIEGALGTGTTDQEEFVLAPSTEGVVQAAVGRFHTCVRDASSVRCAGENEHGRLGTADLNRRSAFTRIASPER